MSGTVSATLAWLGLGPVGGLWIGSQAHRKANDFVDKIQNPYSKDISAILDPIYAKANAGTATLKDFQDAQTAYEKRVAQFQDDASQWLAQGGAYGKVAEQGFETLDPQWKEQRAFFERNIAALTPNDGPPAPPTMDSVVGGGRTAQQQMDLTARLARENAIAGGGLRTTFLGGGLDKGLKQQPRTLLGY